MKKIILEKLHRITKNKKKLEKELNVKITNRGKEVFIDGEPEDEYYAEKVIDALNFGFPFETALTIKKENLIFEILNIKDYTRRKDLERIKARIIGKKGKTLSVLHGLTKCSFELKDNTVGIIGNPEYIKNAQEAVIAIIKGSKQSNVYNFLEKNQSGKVLDLGLK
jgi:ribosomal RNA assembly protein|tara:strand:- start:346 stop:843 length:498 start_codon:yes stop_codon:yes gene_type:complete